MFSFILNGENKTDKEGNIKMFHKISMIGNLGRDPELRYLSNGGNNSAVASFSVASTRSYKNNNNNLIKETTWFRCSAWGKTAEAVNNFLKKGSKVYIEGHLSPDANGNPKVFQRNDGSSGASYDVVVDTILFLDNRSESSGEQNQISAYNAASDFPRQQQVMTQGSQPLQRTRRKQTQSFTNLEPMPEEIPF